MRSQSFREKPKGMFNKGKEVVRSSSFNGHSGAQERFSRLSQSKKDNTIENQEETSLSSLAAHQDEEEVENSSLASLGNIKTLRLHSTTEAEHVPLIDPSMVIFT